MGAIFGYIGSLPMWFQLFVITGGLLLAGCGIAIIIYKFYKARHIDVKLGPVETELDMDNQVKEEVK